MSARTIKNPATVSGQGNLASDSLTLSNTVNCVLTSNATGDLLANGVPVGGGGSGVDSITAGDGISVSGSSDVQISNTGVLALTAGSNITITGTNDNLTINSTGGSSNIWSGVINNKSSPFTFNVPINTLNTATFNLTNFNVSNSSVICPSIIFNTQLDYTTSQTVNFVTTTYINSGSDCTLNINYYITSNIVGANASTLSSINLIVLNP